MFIHHLDTPNDEHKLSTQNRNEKKKMVDEEERIGGTNGMIRFVSGVFYI